MVIFYTLFIRHYIVNTFHDSKKTRFSSISEASASELLENLEEMFPLQY